MIPWHSDPKILNPFGDWHEKLNLRLFEFLSASNHTTVGWKYLLKYQCRTLAIIYTFSCSQLFVPENWSRIFKNFKLYVIKQTLIDLILDFSNKIAIFVLFTGTTKKKLSMAVGMNFGHHSRRSKIFGYCCRLRLWCLPVWLLYNNAKTMK